MLLISLFVAPYRLHINRSGGRYSSKQKKKLISIFFWHHYSVSSVTEGWCASGQSCVFRVIQIQIIWFLNGPASANSPPFSLYVVKVICLVSSDKCCSQVPSLCLNYYYGFHHPSTKLNIQYGTYSIVSLCTVLVVCQS